MKNSFFDDTIAAIATPLGVGGIGVVRISGEKAISIVKKIFKGKIIDFAPNRIHHGWVHEQGAPVDEVIVLYFKSPKSFTGEDVVEIQCHGGVSVVKKILKLCLASGARLAERGEFSKRAFVNGKMDLSKAEAVLDMVHARTDKFAQLSVLNLSGKLAAKIITLRGELLDLLSKITAAVDFPEDVAEPEYSFIEATTASVVASIDEVLKGAGCSNLMRDGAKVAIIGRPNAGKSSLFNALLDIDRAIVTEIPGTTRDVIQESIDIDGIPVTLVDTAGLRESDDRIESIGISLSRQAAQNADVVLHVCDLTVDNLQENFDIKHQNLIRVGSKADLAGNMATDRGIIPVSSVKKTGLDQLKQEIKDKILNQNQDGACDNEFCTNLRQQECLQDAKGHLLQVLAACELMDPQDLISIDLKSALVALGEITGEVVSDEILDNIFSNFCIGK